MTTIRHRRRRRTRINRTHKLVALLALGAIAVAAFGSIASAATGEKRTIAQTGAASGQFTTLTKLLKQAGLVSTLQRPGSTWSTAS